MWYVKIYTTCVDLTQNVLNTFLIAMMETIKQHVETSVMETVSFHLFQEMSEPFRHQRNGYKQLNFTENLLDY